MAQIEALALEPLGEPPIQIAYPEAIIPDADQAVLGYFPWR
jgi:hypothetical protein